MGKLDLDSLEPSVRELVERIKKHSYSEFDIVIEAAQELIEIAKSQGNKAIHGYALYNLAYAFYNKDNVTKAFVLFEEAVTFLSESEQWAYLASAYCVLGIISNSQGNVSLAMDYYLRGVSVCECHDVISTHAVIDCNIGILYLGYHDYKNAELYFQGCIDYAEEVKQAEGDYEPSFSCLAVATFYYNKANIDVILGNINKAIENLQIAAHLEQKSPNVALALAMKMLKTQILHIRGNQKELDKCIKEIDRKSVV